MKKLYLHILLLVIPVLALAQPGCKLRTFTMVDGLPSSTISTCAVAPDGMLWIATWNGLCNYDGYRFNTFVNPMGKGQVLTSNRLFALAPTSSGDVWITTFDARLYKLSAKEQKYVDFQPELEKIGLQNFETNNVRTLQNDVVWILGKNGTNVRVVGEELEVVPTSISEAERCNRVLLVGDREWLVGEKTFRLYNGKANHKVANARIYAARDKFLIVSDKIYLFDAKDEKLTQLPIPQEIEQISESCQLSSGDVALATNDGIHLVNATNHKVRKLADACEKNLFVDGKDRLWSILPDGRVQLVDIKKNEVKTMSCSQPDEWPSVNAREPLVHEDVEGTVWLVTSSNCFCFYDENAGQLTPIDFRTIGGSAYPDFQILKPLSDTRKNLWFTSTRNLSVMSFHNYSFRNIPIINGVEIRSAECLGNGDFIVGSKDGHLALVSSSGHLKGFYSSDGNLVNAEYDEHKSSARVTKFAKNGIYALFKDHKSRIWAGTRGDGLYLLTAAGNGYRVKRFSTENTPSISCNDYFDIAEDSHHRIWFGTYQHGFMMLDEKAGNFDAANSSESSAPVFYSEKNCKTFALPEGDLKKIRRIDCVDGTIWMSSADGIITFKDDFNSPEQIKFSVRSHVPGNPASLLARDVLLTLVCKKSENVFVSTMGGGVQRLGDDASEQSGDSENDNASKMLFSQSEMGNVQSMIEDSQGRIWAVGENSIYSYSPDGRPLSAFAAEDWGKDVEMSEARSRYDKASGNIIVPVMGGVITFNPNEQQLNDFKPSIVFSGVQYQGDERITPLLGKDGITLPTDRHNAMVYFSALDYSSTKLVRYAYRIREIDKDWTFVGAEHCAPLSNLPPGDFTLEVRSTNSEGLWVDNNTELRIHVVPTFWQTPWAILLYILILAGLLYGLFYVYKLKNTARVEKEIKERQLRFFTNISHQLRTPLTLIGGPVSEVLKTETLSDQARNYLQFVENNSERMLGLVNKSLDLNKLQQLNGEMEQDLAVQQPPQQDGVGENSTAPDLVGDSVTDDITILVVEDNDELRYFLTTALSTHYNVIEAENGKVGLKLASEKMPDFIITDIMMPEMDGITMIKRIKADEAICHIPIIILSARTADVYRIEGLQEGADDYITKPFSIAYLQLRVESIIHNRKMLQATWRRTLSGKSENQADLDCLEGIEAMKSVDAEKNAADTENRKNASDSGSENGDSSVSQQSNQVALAPADRRFVERLTAFVEANIDNENLVIDDIAKELLLSRSVLYGKVKTIYGFSPNDFVRNLRLTRACDLLLNHPEKNISEIAYSVGFADPKYFARTFKQHTGKSPSEYRRTE